MYTHTHTYIWGRDINWLNLGNWPLWLLASPKSAGSLIKQETQGRLAIWVPRESAGRIPSFCEEVSFFLLRPSTYWGRPTHTWRIISFPQGLVVQWLGLHISNAGGMGFIPGWGTKIPHVWCSQKSLKKRVNILSSKFIKCLAWRGLACCNSWGHKESDMTEWLNWTELNLI